MGALVVGAATPASAPSVSITDDGIEPPTVVVPLGTELSPTLAPGETYSFRRLGSFPYRDPLHPNLEATVHVVPAGTAGKTARPTGSPRRTYRVVASLSLVESHVYYDPDYRATKGTCVREEGRATRTVRWTARFANATYARVSGSEVFYGEKARTPLERYRETVSARWLEGEEPVLPCPDVSRNGVYVKHNCSVNVDRKPLVLQIGWSSETGTFLLSNNGPSIYTYRDGPHHGYTGRQCGSTFLRIEELNPRGAPVAFGTSQLHHDGFSVVPRAAELAALRAGRSVRIARTLDFRARVDRGVGRTGYDGGGIFDVRASVSIVLTPR